MNKSTFTAIALCFAGFVFANTSSVSAQEAGSGETTYNFDDDLVTGDLVRPDGELLNVRRRGRRASLIRVREHFVPEMLKSIENL